MNTAQKNYCKDLCGQESGISCNIPGTTLKQTITVFSHKFVMLQTFIYVTGVQFRDASDWSIGNVHKDSACSKKAK